VTAPPKGSVMARPRGRVKAPPIPRRMPQQAGSARSSRRTADASRGGHVVGRANMEAARFSCSSGRAVRVPLAEGGGVPRRSRRRAVPGCASIAGQTTGVERLRPGASGCRAGPAGFFREAAGCVPPRVGLAWMFPYALARPGHDQRLRPGRVATRRHLKSRPGAAGSRPARSRRRRPRQPGRTAGSPPRPPWHV
jgi:hypothetical protein